MPFQLQRVKTPKINTAPIAAQGNSIGDREKQHLKPTNERLWHLFTVQARAKFVKYPSPTASAWVHRKYVQAGGKFIDTAKESERERALRHIQESKEKHKKHKKHDKDDK